MKKITKDIYWVGTEDRETKLFENMFELPFGVMYHAYFIDDEKTAVIDCVKDMTEDAFLSAVQAGLKGRDLDYIVLNHMEPDHSSAVLRLVERYPNARILCSAKAVAMLKNFYGIEKNVEVVKEGDTLSLGNNTLTWVMVPMVHWPESMMTYAVEQKVLFSTDAFGGFGIFESIFADEVTNEHRQSETVRYYANIVGKVSAIIDKTLARVLGFNLPIDVICPSHGLIWRGEDVATILNEYIDLSQHRTKPKVTIAYSTMYGNNEESAKFLYETLRKENVEVTLYNLSETEKSFVVADIWQSQVVLLGAPAYYGGIHPKMRELLMKLEEGALINHTVGVFGNAAWSGGGVRGIESFLKENKIEMLSDSVEVMGWPTKEDQAALAKLAQSAVKALKQ